MSKENKQSKNVKRKDKPTYAIVKFYYPDGQEEHIEADVGTVDRQRIYEGDSPTDYIVPFLIKKHNKE